MPPLPLKPLISMAEAHNGSLAPADKAAYNEPCPDEAGRKLYNQPSPSEKLTDGTLPLSWPAPYLNDLKSADKAAAPTTAEPSLVQAELSPETRVSDDYARLIHRLRAESAAASGSTNGDKALCAAHNLSTLIAALAFFAMVGIGILNFFPALIQH